MQPKELVAALEAIIGTGLPDSLRQHRKLADAMMNACLKEGQPGAYFDDLRTDLSIINSHPDCKQFVWLIRSCGTEIMPVGQGFNSAHITYWNDPSFLHGQDIAQYLIEGESVKEISWKRAEELATQKPRFPGTLNSMKFVEEVNRWLDVGISEKRWGMMYPPKSRAAVGGWHNWVTWFSSIGNYVMKDWMESCISRAESLNESA